MIITAFQGEMAHVDQELTTKQELQRRVSGDFVMGRPLIDMLMDILLSL